MRKAKKKKKKANGKWYILFCLLLCLFIFLIYSSTSYGCPNVWLVSILMLSQRALGVLIYDEKELPGNIFIPALLERVQRVIFVLTDFAGGESDQQESLSASNCFESKSGRIHTIKSKDH